MVGTLSTAQKISASLLLCAIACGARTSVDTSSELAAPGGAGAPSAGAPNAAGGRVGSSAGAPNAAGSAGAANSAGAASAGAPSAGASSAGAPNAGASTGGAASGGAETGGSASAGAPSAGAPSGGTTGSAGSAGCGMLDPQTDSKNCGACGHDCFGGACKAGVCQPVALVSNQQNPIFVAVNATNIYWDLAHGSVLTQPLAGGPPTLLYSGNDAEGLVIDSTYIYWSTYLSNTILRMPLGGGEVVTLLTTDRRPLGVAVDATSLYFTTFYGELMKMPIGGGTPVTIMPSSVSFAAGVAVNATDIFFGTATGVQKVPIGGGSPALFWASQGVTFGVTLDALNLYRTEQYGAAVSKVPLSGTGPTTLISGFSAYAGGIAVDATSIYWSASDYNSVGSIMRLAK
jgi:hypothetical protein